MPKPNDVDDFSAAFDEAATDAPDSAVAATARQENVDGVDDAPAPVADTDTDTDAAALAADTDTDADAAAPTAAQPPAAQPPAAQPPAAQPPAAQPPAAQPPAASTAEAQPPLDPRYLAQAIAEAQANLAKPPAPPQKTADQLTLDDFLSDADKAVLTAFDAEWDEVAPAMNIRVNAAVQLALTQARAQWESQLAPIAQTMQQSQATSHDAAILRAHPDLETIKGDVVGWIAGQPAITRPALEAIAARGTAAQVVELLNMYKEAKGMSGAAPVTPASSAAQVDPAVTKAAAATAAVVTGTRSAIVAPPSDDDFSAAWREAANS